MGRAPWGAYRLARGSRILGGTETTLYPLPLEIHLFNHVQFLCILFLFHPFLISYYHSPGLPLNGPFQSIQPFIPSFLPYSTSNYIAVRFGSVRFIGVPVCARFKRGKKIKCLLACILTYLGFIEPRYRLRSFPCSLSFSVFFYMTLHKWRQERAG